MLMREREMATVVECNYKGGKKVKREKRERGKETSSVVLWGVREDHKLHSCWLFGFLELGLSVPFSLVVVRIQGRRRARVRVREKMKMGMSANEILTFVTEEYN